MATLLRVGLTGGLGSGKSTAARELQRLGCHLIEADRLGHEALRRGGEAFQPALDAFGPGILGPDGEIDRKKLGDIVFADPGKLAALNAIVHPAVRRLGAARIAALSGGILIYEAAILVETGGYRDFDKLVVAACPAEMQVSRAMARDGAERDAVIARLSRQMPLSEKIRHADYVIDTSGTMAETLDRTAAVYRHLLSDLETKAEKRTAT